MPGRSQWGAPAAPTVRPLLWIIFDSGQRELIDAPLTLGRAPASVEGSRSVVVPDTTVSLSRTHMRVGPTANGAWIEDSFSANGTQIRTPDGRITALTGGQAVEVPAGTEILRGERRAAIVCAAPATAPRSRGGLGRHGGCGGELRVSAHTLGLPLRLTLAWRCNRARPCLGLFASWCNRGRPCLGSVA